MDFLRLYFPGGTFGDKGKILSYDEIRQALDDRDQLKVEVAVQAKKIKELEEERRKYTARLRKQVFPVGGNITMVNGEYRLDKVTYQEVSRYGQKWIMIITDKDNWDEAQEFCRKHFSDKYTIHCFDDRYPLLDLVEGGGAGEKEYNLKRLTNVIAERFLNNRWIHATNDIMVSLDKRYGSYILQVKYLEKDAPINHELHDALAVNLPLMKTEMIYA